MPWKKGGLVGLAMVDVNGWTHSHLYLSLEPLKVIIRHRRKRGVPGMLVGSNRLAESQKAYDAVCELLKSPVLSKGNLFYLAQLREVLGNEISELRKEVKQPIPFSKAG